MLSKKEYIADKIKKYYQEKNKQNCIKKKIIASHQNKNKEECIKKKIIEAHQKKNEEECIKKKIIEGHQRKNKEECIKKKIAQAKQNKNDNDCIQAKTEKYYREKSQIKKQIDAYHKLAKEDIIYQILNNLASRINSELKKRNIPRTLTYTEFLGCSPQDFKIYLQEKFTEGMGYDNYGERIGTSRSFLNLPLRGQGAWEVDHKFPISKVDFKNIKEIEACFHYTNLQPLWWLDNRKKSNKINEIA